MLYDIFFSKQYKKSFAKLSKNDQNLTDEIVYKRANGIKLEPKYKDHALSGAYEGFRDCHIKPDLLLIYKINKNALELYLADLGSHSKLDF